MRRPPWHVRWALLALLFQAVPWAGFFWIANGVYGSVPSLSPESGRPLTLALLAISSILGAGLGTTATYLLFRRTRLRVAIPLITVCCVPALLGSVLYAHALLVFLTFV
jgi:hypothetical protein